MRTSAVTPRIEILALVASAAFWSGCGYAAEPDWREAPAIPEKARVWVDMANAKYEGANVTTSIKVQKADGKGGFYTWLFDCANNSIRFLGGEDIDADGKTKSASVEEKPTPAPAGSSPGIILRFVCDGRPAWRRLIN